MVMRMMAWALFLHLCSEVTLSNNGTCNVCKVHMVKHENTDFLVVTGKVECVL